MKNGVTQVGYIHKFVPGGFVIQVWLQWNITWRFLASCGNVPLFSVFHVLAAQWLNGFQSDSIVWSINVHFSFFCPMKFKQIIANVLAGFYLSWKTSNNHTLEDQKYSYAGRPEIFISSKTRNIHTLEDQKYSFAGRPAIFIRWSETRLGECEKHPF